MSSIMQKRGRYPNENRNSHSHSRSRSRSRNRRYSKNRGAARENLIISSSSSDSDDSRISRKSYWRAKKSSLESRQQVSKKSRIISNQDRLKTHGSWKRYRKAVSAVRVCAYKNGSYVDGHVVAANSVYQILSEATKKLDLPSAGRRIFNETGEEIFSMKGLKCDEVIYISCGEAFRDPFERLRDVHASERSKWTQDGIVHFDEFGRSSRTTRRSLNETKNKSQIKKQVKQKVVWADNLDDNKADTTNINGKNKGIGGPVNAVDRLLKSEKAPSHRRATLYLNGAFTRPAVAVVDTRDALLSIATRKLDLVTAARHLYNVRGEDVIDPLTDEPPPGCSEPVFWVAIGGARFDPAGPAGFLNSVLREHKLKLRATRDQIEESYREGVKEDTWSPVISEAIKKRDEETDILMELRDLRDFLGRQTEEKNKADERLRMKAASSKTLQRLSQTGQLKLWLFRNKNPLSDNNSAECFLLWREDTVRANETPAEFHCRQLGRLLDQCTSRLNLSVYARKAFLKDGTEVKETSQLYNDAFLWISCGEEFRKSDDNDINGQKKIETVIGIQQTWGLSGPFNGGGGNRPVQWEGLNRAFQNAFDNSTGNYNQLGQSWNSNTQCGAYGSHSQAPTKTFTITIGQRETDVKEQLWKITENDTIHPLSDVGLCLSAGPPGHRPFVNVEACIRPRQNGDSNQVWGFTTSGQIYPRSAPELALTVQKFESSTNPYYSQTQQRLVLTPRNTSDTNQHWGVLLRNRPPASRPLMRHLSGNAKKVDSRSCINPAFSRRGLVWPVTLLGDQDDIHKWPLKGYMVALAPSFELSNDSDDGFGNSSSESSDESSDISTESSDSSNDVDTSNSCKAREEARRRREPPSVLRMRLMRNGEFDIEKAVQFIVPHDLISHWTKTTRAAKKARRASTRKMRRELQDQVDMKQSALMNALLDQMGRALSIHVPIRKLFTKRGKEINSMSRLKNKMLLWISSGAAKLNPDDTTTDTQRREQIIALMNDIARNKLYYDYISHRDGAHRTLLGEEVDMNNDEYSDTVSNSTSSDDGWAFGIFDDLPSPEETARKDKYKKNRRRRRMEQKRRRIKEAQEHPNKAKQRKKRRSNRKRQNDATFAKGDQNSGDMKHNDHKTINLVLQASTRGNGNDLRLELGLQRGGEAQRWTLTDEGYILSVKDPRLAITMEAVPRKPANSGVDNDPDTIIYRVDLAKKRSMQYGDGDSHQTWSATSDGGLRCDAKPDFVLQVANNTGAGGRLELGETQSWSNGGQRWVILDNGMIQAYAAEDSEIEATGKDLIEMVDILQLMKKEYAQLLIKGTCSATGQRLMSSKCPLSKRIRAYRNGASDPLKSCTIVASNIQELLKLATVRLKLPSAARCVFDADGTRITSIANLNSNQDIWVTGGEPFRNPETLRQIDELRGTVAEYTRALRRLEDQRKNSSGYESGVGNESDDYDARNSDQSDSTCNDSTEGKNKKNYTEKNVSREEKEARSRLKKALEELEDTQNAFNEAVAPAINENSSLLSRTTPSVRLYVWRNVDVHANSTGTVVVASSADDLLQQCSTKVSGLTGPARRIFTKLGKEINDFSSLHTGMHVVVSSGENFIGEDQAKRRIDRKARLARQLRMEREEAVALSLERLRREKSLRHQRQQQQQLQLKHPEKIDRPSRIQPNNSNTELIDLANGMRSLDLAVRSAHHDSPLSYYPDDDDKYIYGLDIKRSAVPDKENMQTPRSRRKKARSRDLEGGSQQNMDQGPRFPGDSDGYRTLNSNCDNNINAKVASNFSFSGYHSRSRDDPQFHQLHSIDALGSPSRTVSFEK